MTDLITSSQAAGIAGIAPSTFRTLVSKPSTKSPVPGAVMQAGGVSLWDRRQIELWAATRNRKRGRAPRL